MYFLTEIRTYLCSYTDRDSCTHPFCFLPLTFTSLPLFQDANLKHQLWLVLSAILVSALYIIPPFATFCLFNISYCNPSFGIVQFCFKCTISITDEIKITRHPYWSFNMNKHFHLPQSKSFKSFTKQNTL